MSVCVHFLSPLLLLSSASSFPPPHSLCLSFSIHSARNHEINLFKSFFENFMTNCITYEIFITMGYWRLLLGGICISILVCITMWRYLSRFLCVCVLLLLDRTIKSVVVVWWVTFGKMELVTRRTLSKALREPFAIKSENDWMATIC